MELSIQQRYPYERLPHFCFRCGIIGHGTKSCDLTWDDEANGQVVKNSELPYGTWLKFNQSDQQKLGGMGTDRVIDKINMSSEKFGEGGATE